MRLNQLGPNVTKLVYSNADEVLYSYETPVAVWIEGVGWYRTEKKHSVTTSKHLNQWVIGPVVELVPQEAIDTFAESAGTTCPLPGVSK